MRNQARATRTYTENLFVLAMVVLPPLALFAPVLFRDYTLAFRDTASFYYPLFEWIETETKRGELPLWNPHVNFGTPVVGEASTSVFYPGKLLLALPLEFSWKFKLYVVGHVFLAAGGAYYAARTFGVSRAAAALAAISYACGGAVLFQYCNVVFLVGAAWLPLAFAAAEAMFAQHSFTAALALGAVLAMMALGGDPQMAYHAGLAAAAYGFALCWQTHIRSEDKHPQCEGSATESMLRSRVGFVMAMLSIAAVSAFVLSAVQILPAMEASGESERASYHQPRNVYEAARVIASEPGGAALASQGLFREPEPDTHAASIYEFSVAPWHLLDYLVPGCYGAYFPQYRRWIMALPSEPRMWNQSVYLGLLPILLAMASLRLRSGSIREQWLSWCAVLAVLASFGAFGVGWVLQQPLLLASQPELAQMLPSYQVGGIYWFFVTFLPGYAYFRYPAKLLTFAAWPLCLLAAVGLDRLCRSEMPRLKMGLAVLSIATPVAAAALFLVDPQFECLAHYIAPDTVYGPFDSEGAFRDLLLSLLHTFLVSTALLFALQRRTWLMAAYGPWLLVALTAIELVMANSNMIATAPSEIWRMRPLLAEMLDADRREQGNNSIRPTVRFPVERDVDDPSGWHATSSANRMEELAKADRHLMQTNHCLAGPIDSVETLTTQRLADYTYFYKRYHKNEESFWGNYWIMPQNLEHIGSGDDNDPWHPLPGTQLGAIAKCQVFKHEQPFPRAWIVHEVVVLPELRTRDPYALSLRGLEVVERKSESSVERRNLRKEAVVEGNTKANLKFDASSLKPLESHEQCRIVVDEPNRLVVSVNVSQPGLLVLADTYFPGWTAHANGRDLPILRTDRMFRGVAVSPGEQLITLEYRPGSVFLGAWISGCGWMIALVLVSAHLRSRFSGRQSLSPQ